MLGLFTVQIFEPEVFELKPVDGVVVEPVAVVGGGYVSAGAYSRRQAQLKSWLTPLKAPPRTTERRRRSRKSDRRALQLPLPELPTQVIPEPTAEELLERARARELRGQERARLIQKLRDEAKREQETRTQRINDAIAAAEEMEARALEVDEEEFIIAQILEMELQARRRRLVWLAHLLGPKLTPRPLPPLANPR